ncbi:phosphotransferase [Candidatus Planktophila vernalis]|uniref:phosphotransferase n=1 Tax=Candidatus Planktophila vernalis TaxID=1884907 RepID=UPI001CC197B9|nr:phosphotransferase [Candidatus Planktophila vernalis]
MSDDSVLEQEFGERFNKIALLKARTSIKELSGGLTNRNFLIETPADKYVARVSSNSSNFLAIDRGSEFINTTIAGKGGVGAEVLDYIPGEGLLLISYISGKTFGADDVAANLPRIATSLRNLHALEPFDHEFNMFNTQSNYFKIVKDQGFRVPDGYVDFEPMVAQIKKAFEVLFEGLVPCNNDLLPGNFIDDGKKIWLIDYEYSGNNDACFEIGNVWAEAFQPIEALEELVTAYYGAHRPDKVARAWLWALMAKYGWTLWASIQDSVSEIEFDFWEWGMSKYDLARSEFTSEYFKKALVAVTTK